MSNRDPHSAAEFIIKSAKPYAQAKANRMYLEEHRKTCKALLMNESDGKTVSDREQYAYSHEDYLALLGGLKAAVEIEEKLRWDMVAAQARIEIWRTQSANNRTQDKVLR